MHWNATSGPRSFSVRLISAYGHIKSVNFRSGFIPHLCHTIYVGTAQEINWHHKFVRYSIRESGGYTNTDTEALLCRLLDMQLT